MDGPVDFESSQSVDYTQGFGSFNFTPYELDTNYPSHEEDSWRRSNPNSSKDGKNLEAEPEEPFPFMRLPLELRRNIYEILVARLRSDHEDGLHNRASGNGIRFIVSDTEYEPDGIEIDYNLAVTGPPDQRNMDTNLAHLNVANILDSYMAIQNGIASNEQVPSGWKASSRFLSGANRVSDQTSADEADDSSSDSDYGNPEDVSDINAASHDGARTNRWFPTCHVWVSRLMSPVSGCYHSCGVLIDEGPRIGPSRPHFFTTSSYYSKIGCSCPTDANADCVCLYRQRADYDVIRYLAQTHPQIARELGELLWEGATLDVGDLETLSLFAAARPATLGRVRRLVLRVSCHADVFDTLTSELEVACDLASRVMDLRDCTVVLSTSKARYQGARRGAVQADDESRDRMETRLQDWAPLFRGLRVRERFDLRMQGASDGFGWYSEKMEVNQVEGLRRRILEMWLPDSLR